MKKHNFLIQMMIWLIAILFLIFSLYQLHGDAKVINYAGIVRGGTQRLIKKEMYHQQDDDLITLLDQILFELQTGKGPDQLVRLSDDDFQSKLEAMSSIWEEIKAEIYLVREGKSPELLYTISEGYFDLANATVAAAESISTEKLGKSLILLSVYLLFSTIFLVTMNRRRQKEMKQLFYTDHLTGIGNLMAFQETVSGRFGKGHSYAILYLDIDGFKYMNEMYGYPFGDQLLNVIANCLDQHYPCAAHLDGDNFLVLAYPEENFEEQLRQLLNDTIQQNFSENISKALTYSMGIYITAPYEQDIIDDILDKAELALKQTRGKKDSTAWYDEALLAKLRKEGTLEKELGTAIQDRELKVYLQPKFSLSNNALVGCEALIRWDSATLGYLMPDEFIPLFERNGMIYQIDFYMLEQVCHMIRAQSLDDLQLPISINFSRITLHLDNFYQLFHQIIDAFQIPAAMIELEMTESAFQGISEPSIVVLRQLKEEGFTISIDDFGSGFSSLNMLTGLPINILKIDKEFLVQEPLTNEHRKLITSIIQMAHALHLEVICEGVESTNHVQLLKSAHCDFAQGYYYAKPMPADTFLSTYLVKQAG